MERCVGWGGGESLPAWETCWGKMLPFIGTSYGELVIFSSLWDDREIFLL